MDAIWIAEHNWVPCLEVLASLVGSALDADDHATISLGLRATDFEAGQWFAYEFSGRERVSFRLACDVGTCVLFVAVAASPNVEAEFGPVLRLAQSYRLVRDPAT